MNLAQRLLLISGIWAATAWGASPPQSVYVHRGSTPYIGAKDSSQPLGTRIPVRVEGWDVAALVPPIFVNPGSASFDDPPQINATAFLNLGDFSVFSPLPYDFQNTLYYTNRGTMLAAPGFRFDFTDDAGIRRPAALFVNDSVGTVAGVDAIAYLGYNNFYYQTMLDIRATNVINAGYLGVGNEGSMRLVGQNINLTRGALEVAAITGSPSANSYYEVTDSDPRPDQFEPDNGIYDLYWGAGQQQIPVPGPINTANILRFFGADLVATAPAHMVQQGSPTGWIPALPGAPTSFQTAVSGSYFTAFGNTGVVASTFLTLTNFDGSISNLIVPTNIFRGAIVVGVNDTNFAVRAKFGFAGPALLGFGINGVEIASSHTNVVTGQEEVNRLHFIDYLGSDTNTLIVTNNVVLTPTGRPYDYEIWRDYPFFENLGANGNTPLFNGFLYNGTFSNVFATNLYAGYGATIDNLQNRPPAVPDVGATNTPGRIEIVGDSVDLTKARIQGVTTVQVKAAHLKNSSGALVDVENLIYDLSSTNGLLTVRNLAKDSTIQVRGGARMWTGIWSNQFALILSNWFIDATTNYFNPVTNPVDINLYCWILSADALTRTQQVVTHTLALNSTNVVIDDPLLVSDRLEITAEGLTLNTNLTLSGELIDWTHEYTPGVRYLTNNGRINIPNVGYFGTDYPEGQRLERFVNTGTLNALAHEIAAVQYEDSGTVLAQNDLRLNAATAILNGAFHSIAGAAHYYGQDYKLTDLRLIASRGFFINITNSLADGGPGAGNSIELTDGFQLVRKPALGDLLGTEILTTAPRFVSVGHTWAAEDRGATSAGFLNNVAVGKLTLDSQPGGELRLGPPTDALGFPLPGQYGLYVDYLEFGTNRVAGNPSVADDPESVIVIEPGLTLYFGTSNLGNEELDGRFEGRLRWVRDYSGPASGVDVALRDGRTIRVNVGLVDSQTIDSDGDGLVNGFDIFPFDDVLITDFRIASVNPFTTELAWRAAAETAYQVSFATNLTAPKWSVFAGATNSAPTIQVLSVRHTLDTGANPPGGLERYYRVSYDP